MNSASSQEGDGGGAVAANVSFGEALRVWLKIGLLSFGGPAGQIALMHRILVDEKRWIDEVRFLHALNYCMLLPGPEAQQLIVYVGWLLHGTRGGLAAGILFVLPGAIVILVLSILYAAFRDLAIIEAVFFGIKAAVLAIVVEAVLRIGGKVLKNRILVAIARRSLHCDLLSRLAVSRNRGCRGADRAGRRPLRPGPVRHCPGPGGRRG